MTTRALLLTFGLGLAAGCGHTVVKHKFQPMAVKAPPPDVPPPPVKKAVAELEETRIDLGEKVQFAFGSARILPESHELLRQVAQIMIENPQVTLVQIEGHTDAVGKTRKNRKLSQKRAESVRAFLVEQGVEPSRLAATGFGEERPVADNDSDDGREQNRRVEFNILTQTGKVAKK
jgi:outer membrane protein OmpA-like peptidoglycan-associated protein